WLDAGATHESGYSFPSGHTTATTAFAIAIFLTTNKKYSWPILSLPLLMASSRIYLMVHYFSDCVGAWIVGIVVAILAYIIVTLAYKSKLKFFVWIREFNIITPKQKIQISTENVPQNKVEDYVYTTQSEDQTISNIEDNRLIQKEIATKEENNTSDK
ncbi:MAG: phosphatase PAP2 family protein, partial [Clostridia bacterium]|nr:phosphatase PAP2 family protein [Clostridia bacterium]